jgi:hypothetical protein
MTIEQARRKAGLKSSAPGRGEMNLELGYVERRKWSWTDFRVAQADDVIAVVNGLIDYQPLTLRQIYYQLVAAGKRENTRSKYIDLSRLIVAMRKDGMLPWEIIDDRARRISEKRGYEDAGEYVKQVGDFLGRYQRCLVQGQEYYLETWCEKDALSVILEEIAWPYCIRHATCRGYDSATCLKKFEERARAALSKGQCVVLLYFGDFDPSGMSAGDAIQQTLLERHEIATEFVRVALNQDQIEKYSLPHAFEAVKVTDTRAPRFIERFGEYGACELDAIHPKLLREMTVDAIEFYLDMDLFREQQEVESMERQKMAELQERFLFEAKTILGHV